jgi:hypothetical protein
MVRHPLVAAHGQEGFRRRVHEELRARVAQVDVGVVGLPAPLFGSLVGERCVDVGCDVAEVAREVHHFVVAEEHDQAPARIFRLPFEIHQQIEGGSHARAAIRDVAGLDDGGVACDPAAIRVGDAGLLEDAGQPFDIAVDVADDDRPPGVGGLGVGGLGDAWRRWRGEGKEHRQNRHVPDGAEAAEHDWKSTGSSGL